MMFFPFLQLLPDPPRVTYSSVCNLSPFLPLSSLSLKNKPTKKETNRYDADKTNQCQSKTKCNKKSTKTKMKHLLVVSQSRAQGRPWRMVTAGGKLTFL